MCTGIAKSGNNDMFPNLVHSGVASFQIWFILELPGMAKSGNVTVSKSGSFWSFQEWHWCVPENPKVAITFCFQIWLFPWSCQEWPKLAMYMFPYLALLAITEHTFAIPGNSRTCQIWKQLHCHFWQSLSTHLCHSWQLQNVPDLETVTLPLFHSWQLQIVPDLETDTLPLLAITEHTPLPFLATPEYAKFGNSYIATFGNH